jgi:hypothetical protein
MESKEPKESKARVLKILSALFSKENGPPYSPWSDEKEQYKKWCEQEMEEDTDLLELIRSSANKEIAVDETGILTWRTDHFDLVISKDNNSMSFYPKIKNTGEFILEVNTRSKQVNCKIELPEAWLDPKLSKSNRLHEIEKRKVRWQNYNEVCIKICCASAAFDLDYDEDPKLDYARDRGFEIVTMANWSMGL